MKMFHMKSTSLCHTLTKSHDFSFLFMRHNLVFLSLKPASLSSSMKSTISFLKLSEHNFTIFAIKVTTKNTLNSMGKIHG